VGVGKFLLPRPSVLRHRCQHRNSVHSDMTFFTVLSFLHSFLLQHLCLPSISFRPFPSNSL
jgi:hypothetical protein